MSLAIISSNIDDGDPINEIVVEKDIAQPDNVNNIRNSEVLGVSIQFILEFVDNYKILNNSDNATGEICSTIIKPLAFIHESSYIDYFMKHDAMNHCSSRYIGKANVFVSHAWNYNFIEFVKTIHEWNSKNRNDDKEYYFWIDIFCSPQTSEIMRPFDWWEIQFRTLIVDIGFTLIVFLPWTSPIYIKRSWCLYEFFITIDGKLDYEIALAPDQKKDFVKSLCSEGFMENRFTSIFGIDIKQATSFYKSDTDMILSLVEQSIGFNAMNQILLNEMRKWIVSICSDIVEKIAELPTCSDTNNTVLSNISIFILYLINGEVGYRILEKIYDVKKRHFGESSLNALFSRLRYAMYILCVSTEKLSEAPKLLMDIDKGLKRLEKANVDTREIRICYNTMYSVLEIHNGKPISAFNTLKVLVYQVFNVDSVNSLPFHLSNYDKSNMGILFSSYCYYNNIDVDSEDFRILSSIVNHIRSIFGETFPHTVMTSTFYSLLLIKGGRIVEAEDILNKNLVYARIYIGYDHVLCSEVQSSKCVIYIARKEYDKAIFELEEIIRYYEKFRYIEIIVVKFTLAKVLAIQNKFSEAEKIIRSATEFSQSIKAKSWKEIVPGSSVEEWYQVYVYVLKRNGKYVEASLTALVLGLTYCKWYNVYSSVKRLHRTDFLN